MTKKLTKEMEISVDSDASRETRFKRTVRSVEELAHAGIRWDPGIEKAFGKRGVKKFREEVKKIEANENTDSH